jgi:hypothetical protein
VATGRLFTTSMHGERVLRVLAFDANSGKQSWYRELQDQQVEKTVEAMYNGLNALSEVAKDSGDLGVIAGLSE